MSWVVCGNIIVKVNEQCILVLQSIIIHQQFSHMNESSCLYQHSQINKSKGLNYDLIKSDFKTYKLVEAK